MNIVLFVTFLARYRGRRQHVFVPGTGQFPNSTLLEPTRAARVLDIVLSSQKEFVDNVVIQEPLGSSDHNQLHFNINIKSEKTKVKQGGILGKVTIRKLGNV